MFHLPWISILLCFVVGFVYSAELPLRSLTRQSRDAIIKYYFEKGFCYELILCFLIQYRVYISLSTLKRALRRLGLRRRGGYSSLRRVGDCLLVRYVNYIIIMKYDI